VRVRVCETAVIVVRVRHAVIRIYFLFVLSLYYHYTT
jgi:hypothetical protein